MGDSVRVGCKESEGGIQEVVVARTKGSDRYLRREK